MHAIILLLALLLTYITKCYYAHGTNTLNHEQDVNYYSNISYRLLKTQLFHNNYKLFNELQMEVPKST